MKIIKVIILTVLCHVNVITAAPTSDKDINKINKAIGYLVKFGYLDDIDNRIADIKVVDNAVADFQRFAGLDTTGKLDNETLHLMSLPRCGVRDLVGTGSDIRVKRYALQGSVWKIKNLTYKIRSYPSTMDKKDVESEIARAFDTWAQHTDLTFEPTTGDPKIDIQFEFGEHGDLDPFDGPGGTLAHAFFPVYGGDAHFDASEDWSTNTFRGTNLFQAAAHEFGHALGLSHSDVQSSLMAPFYRGYDPTFELDIDDIQAIQALYGVKPLENRFDTDDTVFEDTSPLCKDFEFDTIFTSPTGELIIFKSDSYWKITDLGLVPGYPKKIASRWRGLPSNIDAAFSYKNGKTYFFKGKEYWRYKGAELDGAYPKPISVGFPGIPDRVDAAVVWSGNGKLYFFKGNKYWRFDPSSKPPIKGTYPKLVSNWQGVPDNIDAATQYRGITYFFKDGVYYAINDVQFSIEAANPNYPRSIAYWWFGCKSSPNGTIISWS